MAICPYAETLQPRNAAAHRAVTARAWADHFSATAAGYSRYRPTYPDALYDYLAASCARTDMAWDCACGNGQATRGLAGRFKTVVATDASLRQLRRAPSSMLRVVSRAKAVPLRSECADLIAVAQALHWFAAPEFYAEVERIARRGATFAAWSYNLLRCDPAIDTIVDALAYGTVGDYWPQGRKLVDTGYRDLALPFPEQRPPQLAMTARWTLARLVGYLRTWSAVQRYRTATGEDAVAAVEPRLSVAWGDHDRERNVSWPLTIRVAVVK